MGFRNPATSATAVDTGAGVLPGVKVYSDQRNPGAGVVEWDAYSARVLAQLVSSITGSGGSYFSLALNNGPSIGLNVEGLAAGGYQSVMRLSAGAGGAIIPDAPILPDTWHDMKPFFGAYTCRYQETSPWILPQFTRDATGRVKLGGLAAITSAASTLANGYVLATLPAGYRPSKQVPLLCIGHNNRPWRADVYPDGSLIFSGPACSDWTFPTGQGNGYLSLNQIAYDAADVQSATP